MIPFVVFVFCLFLTYAIYLVATRGSEKRRQRLNQRLSEALMHSSSVEDVEVQLARSELMSEIPAMNRALMHVPIATRLKRMLDQADLQITVTRLLMFSAMAGLLAAMAASVLTISLIVIFATGLAAAGVPFLHVWWARRKRLNKFLEHLPDALELMSRALQAGHAFAESLHMISEEMPEPIATEFRKTYEEQNLGLSLKLALENLTQRIPLMDLRMCVTAIMIQRETGGNLAEILEKVAHTIRERFRIMEDLKTLTTSSRMSAWILCGLPIFVAVAVTFMNPDYMSILWKDPRGHNLIAIAMTLQIVGMLVIRKILRIKI
ncbi:MAG: type II secretion system F family protein [Acidobacteria bacterium]|nr:type II secretion system F family protein [Acidobacteriota bacterium]MCA1642663.1 type II secretion system F family protein [Acidobacteriota bacterium]